MAFGPSERCFSNPAGACSKLRYGPQPTFRVDYRKIKIHFREYLLGFRVSRVIFTGILFFFRSDGWWKSEIWVLLWFLVRFKSGIGGNHHILDTLLLLNLGFFKFWSGIQPLLRQNLLPVQRWLLELHQAGAAWTWRVRGRGKQTGPAHWYIN